MSWAFGYMRNDFGRWTAASAALSRKAAVPQSRAPEAAELTNNFALPRSWLAEGSCTVSRREKPMQIVDGAHT